MRRLTKTRFVIGSLTCAGVGLLGCQAPPELPPADSMSFLEFSKGTASKPAASASDTTAQPMPLTDGPGTTTNVDVAAVSVGLVTGAVNLALLWPRLFFAGALTAHAEHSGGTWTWDKTFPLAGWRAVLTGKLNQSLVLEMHVTGLRGTSTAYQNFLWYTGDHQTNKGRWTIFDKNVTGPVLNIDWARRSASDKDVTFVNVTQGVPQNGDTLAYTLRGNVATMAIHDALSGDLMPVPADFSVSWNIVTGEGQMKKNAQSFCWDTLAKGQVDTACPATAWPMP